MSIPLGLRVWFNGDDADIPVGWSRDTDYDGRYLQHHQVTSGTNGGITAHPHTGPLHLHKANDHNHKASIPGIASGGIITSVGVSPNVQVAAHGHLGQTGLTSRARITAVTPVVASFNSEPPFHELILIKPDTVDEIIPNNAILLGDRDLSLDNASLPGDYFIADGNNSTPDLDDRFIKTPAAGGDSGGTGGSVDHGGGDHGTLLHAHPGNHNHPDAELGSII